MPGFDPNKYVTVAERVQRAKDDIQTIVAEPPAFLTEVMGYIRVTVALKDGRSSTGTASFRTDLTGGRAQATNPLEDCETSAIGRALGLLGYGSLESIASREEVQEAQRRQEQRPTKTEYVPAPDTTELKRLVTTAKEAGVKLPVSVAGKVPGKMSAEEIRIAVLDLQMAIERNPPTDEPKPGGPVDLPL